MRRLLVLLLLAGCIGKDDAIAHCRHDSQMATIQIHDPARRESAEAQLLLSCMKARGYAYQADIASKKYREYSLSTYALSDAEVWSSR
jgi:hypothetical protein